MKKILTLILVILFSLNILACGNKGDSGKKEVSENKTAKTEVKREIKSTDITPEELNKLIPIARQFQLNESQLRDIVVIIKSIGCENLDNLDMSGLSFPFKSGTLSQDALDSVPDFKLIIRSPKGYWFDKYSLGNRDNMDVDFYLNPQKQIREIKCHVSRISYVLFKNGVKSKLNINDFLSSDENIKALENNLIALVKKTKLFSNSSNELKKLEVSLYYPELKGEEIIYYGEGKVEYLTKYYGGKNTNFADIHDIYCNGQRKLFILDDDISNIPTLIYDDDNGKSCKEHLLSLTNSSPAPNNIDKQTNSNNPATKMTPNINNSQTPVSVNSQSSVPPISENAIASVKHSSADNEDGYNHSGALTTDGDTKTCWAEGVPGFGIGEHITYYFNGNYKVSGLNIWTGHQKTEDLFYKNARPTAIRVIGSDGSNVIYPLNDVMGMQRVTFNSPITINNIKLVVEKVAPGNKYEDTCIAEVNFF